MDELEGRRRRKERRQAFGERVLAERARRAERPPARPAERWQLGEDTPPRDVVVRLEHDLGLEPGALLHLLGYEPLDPASS